MNDVENAFQAGDAGSNALAGLMRRLEQENGFAALDANTFDAYVAAPGNSVVLFLDDPVRYPEAWDVAVVLPEVLKAFAATLRAGMLGPEEARKLQPRFGFSRWPALVFLRGGEYVGTIEGMLDWEPFVRQVAQMLEKPTGRAPTIGIAVRNASASGCH